MSGAIKKPAIPGIPISADPELRRFLIAVKEILESYEGLRPNQSNLDKVVKMVHLKNMGVDVDATDSTKYGYDFSDLAV